MLTKLAPILIHVLVLIFTLEATSPAWAHPQNPHAQTADLIPITIGYPQTNYWPLFLARDLKLFEQVELGSRFQKRGCDADDTFWLIAIPVVLNDWCRLAWSFGFSA